MDNQKFIFSENAKEIQEKENDEEKPNKYTSKATIQAMKFELEGNYKFQDVSVKTVINL